MRTECNSPGHRAVFFVCRGSVWGPEAPLRPGVRGLPGFARREHRALTPGA